MVVVFDATMMMLLMRPGVNAPLDPKTGKPVEHAEARIAALVQELDKAKAKIVVPTPALSELLVRAGEATGALVETIQKAAVFRIGPFDTLAAIEVAAMAREAVDAGDKKAGGTGTWAKIKYDRQIVAIAKVQNASVIYTDDGNLRKFSEAQNIKVISLAEIAIPQEIAQGNLALPDPEKGHDESPPDE